MTDANRTCKLHMPLAYAPGLCTDGRTDGRTYAEGLSPTSATSSSVTRTRAYGDWFALDLVTHLQGKSSQERQRPAIAVVAAVALSLACQVAS